MNFFGDIFFQTYQDSLIFKISISLFLHSMFNFQVHLSHKFIIIIISVFFQSIFHSRSPFMLA
jgi:hypothetical protein